MQITQRDVCDQDCVVVTYARLYPADRSLLGVVSDAMVTDGWRHFADQDAMVRLCPACKAKWEAERR